MSTTITVELSDATRAALDDAVRAEGVSASEIVDRAVSRHLFLRRFRALQAETMQHLRESGMGDLTEEDVFTTDSSDEDVQYQLYVRQKVRTGLERAEAEGVIEQGEAEARLAKWRIDL